MKRKNELEVLRVISMLMVLILHTLGHGGILYSYAQESFGYFFFWLIETFCLVAVNCFLLITGYVMLNAKFRPSRIIALILQTEFYSILCTLIVSIIFQKEVSVHQWILSFFPLTSGRYWFMSAYFIILIFFPMFNIFILSIDRGTHFLVNTGLILTFSVIPTILFWSKGIFGNGYQYTWFIVLYFIGAYYKKYKAEYQEINVKNIYYYILFIGGGVLLKNHFRSSTYKRHFCFT